MTEAQLKALQKELDEARDKQRAEDGFAGAAPGNNRPRTDEERAARAEEIKAQLAALRERDQIQARQRAAAAKAG